MRECNGGPNIPVKQRRLEVHHNIPQRYAREHGIDPDFTEKQEYPLQPFNRDIHPDMAVLQNIAEAIRRRFRQVSINRDEMLSRRRYTGMTGGTGFCSNSKFIEQCNGLRRTTFLRNNTLDNSFRKVYIDTLQMSPKRT